MVMVKYFPTDLINDILLRLPGKSLKRFKSVSKPWRSSIDDPCFVTCHLKHSTETNRGSKLIFRRKKDYRLYAADAHSISKPGRSKLNGANELIGLPTQKNGDADSLIGSCNGLICLYHSPNIIFWNKSTGEYHVNMLDDYTLYGYGFGYDSINDDYKAVLIVVSQYGRELIVYNLRNYSEYKYYKGRWISDKGIPWFHEQKTQDDRKGVFVGGAIHWLACQDNNSANNGRFFIFSFDLATALFGRIALPENANCATVGVLGGYLTATCCDEAGKHTDVNIWVMEDMGNKLWTKLYRISANRKLTCVRPLAYLRSGTKILLKADGGNYSGGFLMYRPGRGKLEDCYNTGKEVAYYLTQKSVWIPLSP